VARCNDLRQPNRAPAGHVSLPGRTTLGVPGAPPRLEPLLATARADVDGPAGA
jgi:hypothetical protein